MWQLKNLNHRTIQNYMGKLKLLRKLLIFPKTPLSIHLRQHRKERRELSIAINLIQHQSTELNFEMNFFAFPSDPNNFLLDSNL